MVLVEWAELIKDIIPADARWITIEKDVERGFDFRTITVNGGKR